jgi:hypothetical protein
MPRKKQASSSQEPCQWCFLNALGNRDLTEDQACEAFLEYSRRLQAGTWKRVPGDELLTYGDDEDETTMTADEWRDLESHGEYVVLDAEIELNRLLEHLTRQTIPDDEDIEIRTRGELDNVVKVMCSFGELRERWPEIAQEMIEDLNRDRNDDEEEAAQ